MFKKLKQFKAPAIRMTALAVALSPIFIFGHILAPQAFTYSLYVLSIALGMSLSLLKLVWNTPITEVKQ